MADAYHRHSSCLTWKSVLLSVRQRIHYFLFLSNKTHLPQILFKLFKNYFYVLFSPAYQFLFVLRSILYCTNNQGTVLLITIWHCCAHSLWQEHYYKSHKRMNSKYNSRTPENCFHFQLSFWAWINARSTRQLLPPLSCSFAHCSLPIISKRARDASYIFT